MYKNIFLDISKLIILLGCIAFSFTITWTIIELPYLTKNTINGQTIYIYDTQTYLSNLQLGWTGLQEIWQELLPTREWQNGGSLINWSPMFNNLALVFDWVYMPINLILTIIRTLSYVIIKLFSFIGLITIPNTTINGVVYQPVWFVNLFITIKDYFIIPYI